MSPENPTSSCVYQVYSADGHFTPPTLSDFDRQLYLVSRAQYLSAEKESELKRAQAMNAELIALRQECDEARAQLGLEARLRKERDEARAHISFVMQTTEARLRTERDEARTQLDERTKALCAVQTWSRGKFDEMDYMLRMAQHEKGLIYHDVGVLRKENRQLRYAVAQIVQKAQMRFSQLQAELVEAKTGSSRRSTAGQENAQGELEIIYPPPPPPLASSPVLPLPRSTSPLQKSDFTMLPKTEPFTELDLQYPPEVCQTPNISPPPSTGSKPLPPFAWDPDRKRRWLELEERQDDGGMRATRRPRHDAASSPRDAVRARS